MSTSARKAAPAPVPGLAARKAAMELLSGVLDRATSLADQLGSGALDDLAPEERARAQSLATLTLRHLGRIDALLAGFLDRRPPRPAQHALRLATAEIHMEGVPAHAAVDAAVRLTRGHPKTGHLSGLVNAVGRRIAEAEATWAALPEGKLPDWLDGMLVKAWGRETADAIITAQRAAPPTDITPRDPATAADLARRLGGTLLPTGSIRLAAPGQISRLPGFAEGAWWVQDAAAALPARLLGPVEGLRVLDLCAAPGGKTLQLAAAGARVTALDMSEPRLARLRENLARTRLSAEIVTTDALAWAPDAPFDAILIDAPCSATGTIRRHPDLPYLRRPEDVASLVELQAGLLARAWGWLAPGGRLVACTCSLLPREGERQIARFLAGAPEARITPPDASALGLEPGWIDAAGGLRLRPDFWPDLGGMDGFHAALLTRAGPAPGD